MEFVTLRNRLREFPKSFKNYRKDLSLSNIDRTVLLKSQWDAGSETVVTAPYLLYRFFFAAYFLAGLAVSLTYNDSPGYWILYATNWSFVFQLLYSLSSLINVLGFWYQERFSSNSPRPHLKLTTWESFIWLMLSATYAWSVFISIFFWILVYGGPGDTTGITAILGSLVVHGLNGVLTLVDVMVVAAPLRPVHVLYAVCTPTVYLVFTYVYDIVGGTYKDASKPYVYGILNWRDAPWLALGVSVGVCFIIALMHLFFCLLSILRQHLASSLRRNTPYLEKSDINGETKPLIV